MTEPLPISTYADDMGLRCPWCGAWTEEARISVEDLVAAHDQGSLSHPARLEDETAEACALVVECVSCGRPSMLRLGQEATLLIPVRTAKDAEFLRKAAP